MIDESFAARLLGRRPASRKNLGYQTQFERNGPSRMYHITGLTKDKIIDLCTMVRSAELEPGVNPLAAESGLVCIHGHRADVYSPQ